MRKIILIQLFLWIFFAFSISVPIYHVLTHSVSIFSLIFFLLSGFLAWRLILPHSLPYPKFDKIDIIFIIGSTVVHLIFLALLSSVSYHFHFDEFITAYTSLTLPSITNLNWFGTLPKDWVAQFPLLFFILQKPFFLFGPSVWAVRISTWPYSIGIIFYIYWLTSSLWSKSLARIAVIFYIFFAPTLYISSMGLHFISSEFFYLAAITHLLLYLKLNDSSHLFPLSLYILFCYLTYTSSYVVLPVIILVGLIAIAVSDQRKMTIIHLIKTLAVSLILFLPFLVYNFSDTPFLTERIDQVNIFTGTWTDTTEKLKSGTTLLNILTTQTNEALKSLVYPGIGGKGGYDYGHEALLNPLNTVLLLFGFTYLFICVIKKRFLLPITLFISIIVPFIFGFILTAHPPPFHRISLIYPFLVICMSFSIFSIYNYLLCFQKSIATLTLYWLVILYVIFSIFQTTIMIQKDKDIVNWDSVRIVYYIKRYFLPDTPISIVPSFHYKDELTFRLGNKYPIFIQNKSKAVYSYKGEGPLIIQRASEEELTVIRNKFPYARIITELENRPFEYVTLVAP